MTMDLPSRPISRIWNWLLHASAAAVAGWNSLSPSLKYLTAVFLTPVAAFFSMHANVQAGASAYQAVFNKYAQVSTSVSGGVPTDIVYVGNFLRVLGWFFPFDVFFSCSFQVIEVLFAIFLFGMVQRALKVLFFVAR